MTTIEGEKTNIEPEALPAVASEEPNQVAIFNPLDAPTEQFKQQLIARKDNYEALAMHLRGMLVPGKDFGKIHIMPKRKCAEPWSCTNPTHFSPYMLFAAGADKVLGMLGLGVTYPDEEDIRRSTLKGLLITDIVMKAFIDNGRGQVISEGMGAATRSEESDDLNRTIKKAAKRARVDAVMRLPAISALFEDDFLAQVEKDAAKNGGNSTTSRAQSVNQRHNTGAVLTVFPLGGNLKDQRFDEMEDSALDWCLETFETQAPDIFNAAKREHDRRNSAHHHDGENAGSQAGKGEQPAGGKGSPAEPIPPGAVTTDYDDYPEAQ